MMYEVLTRRYQRALAEHDLPVLLMVDGGKGQLGVAVTVLRELGITEVDVIGLAKMRTERDPFAEEVAHSSERVFLPGRKNPVVLKPNATALFLLQRIRDEAHRFAITYHRNLRAKERLSSPLDAISGGWPDQTQGAPPAFGSLNGCAPPRPKRWAKSPGLPRPWAKKIHQHLRAHPAPR